MTTCCPHREEDGASSPALPDFVQTNEDRHRWDSCVVRAREIIEEPPESQTVWYAALALFHGEAADAPSSSDA